jgi:hypothetical protein
MSKFLLNHLVQISKALVYSKIKFYSEKNFSVAFGPATAHLLFFSTSLFPPPRWASASQPAHLALGRPSRPARQWRPTRLRPSSRGSASSHAAFAPLRTWLTGGPHPSSLTSGSVRVRPAPHLGMPPESLPPHHHSPLIPPLNLAPPSMALKPLTPPLPRPPLPGAPPGHSTLAPIKALPP